MRILLVNKFHYLKGGSEKYYFELGQLLKENGHEVAYFSMKDEKNIVTGDKEYFVEPIDLNSENKLKAMNIIYSRNNYNKMIEAIDDFKPDIIHLNNFQRQLSSSIVKAAYSRKIPIVFTAHDLQAVCPNKDMLYKGNICDDCIEKGYMCCAKKACIKESKLKSMLGVFEAYYYRINNIYEKIDCIISPSEFIKKMLMKGNIKSRRIEVIHNFTSDTVANETHNKGYIFYFGRLSKEKGIFNVVKAIKSIENIKLLIAGDGPQKKEIAEYIKDNKLETKVELLGYLNQEEVKKYIKEAKFIVVPSVWYENCPYSILETMEIGKPIIASRIGGIPELIEDGVNGYLYEYENVDMLADKIRKLYSDEILVKQMGENAKKMFDNKYNKINYYKQIIKIYNDLIEEKNNV